MKKVLSFAVASLLAVSLVACGNNGSSENNNGNTQANNTMQATTTAQQPKEEGQIGDFIVKIKSSEQFKSTYGGQQALMIVLDFTNNGQEAVSFSTAMMAKAFQDGIEIEKVFDVDKLGENADKQIKTGATIEVKIAFAISNQDSPVEVEIEEFLSFSNEKVTQTIELK